MSLFRHQRPMNREFSHYVTVAILRFQNNETAPCCSLHNKRFQSSYCTKVVARAKKKMRNRAETLAS